MKHAAAVLLLLAAAPLPLAAQDEASERRHALGVVPRLTLWRADLGARMEADEGVAPGPVLDGNRLDLEDDLGYEDDSVIPILQVALVEQRGRRRLERVTATFFTAGFDADSTLREDQNFNGRVFSAGSRVESDWNYWSAGIDGAVYESPWDEPTAFAVLVGLRYTSLEFSLSDATQDTDERIRLLWAGVGARVETVINPRFSFVAQAMFFYSGGEDTDLFDVEFESWDAGLVEANAGIRFGAGRLEVEAGLRLVAQTVEMVLEDSKNYEENRFDFGLFGPYVSAVLRF